MKKRRKAVMVIQDGIGDRPLDRLRHQTPLEAAKTPNFDLLCKEGICGLMDPLAPGIRVGTDVGHLALFGYNPLKVYWGRGPIEAAGVDLDMEEGDIALRCNFATVDDDMTIIDRRAQRIRRGTRELAETLNAIKLDDSVAICFKEATEHRAVLIFRGERLSAEVTPSDPGAGNEGEKVQTVQPKQPGFSIAARSAKLINQFIQKSHQVLCDHPVNRQRVAEGKLPANIIITRGCGMKMRMRSLAERFNISGVCIAGESTIIGIAKMTGFDILTDPSFTANTDTDLGKKFDFALDALKSHDFVVVHIKGPDIVSHDNEPLEKVHLFERIDAFILHLLSYASTEDGLYVALTGDHSTPCEIREHSADPVPVAIWGKDVLADSVEKYGERSCAKGGLGRITANQFLLTILDLMGATYRFGA